MADRALNKPQDARRKGGSAPVGNKHTDGHESAEQAFIDVFEPVIIDEPAPFEFDGAIRREHMKAIWSWLIRDVSAELCPAIENALSQSGDAHDVIKKQLPALMTQMRSTLDRAAGDADLDRRLTTQIGGEEVRARLDVVLNAMRCQHLFEKAIAFGKATNTIADEAALANALQSMPLKEPKVAALLLHAVVGQTANPIKLMAAVAHAAGSSSEAVIIDAKLGPVVDACLAHAQNQLPKFVAQGGVFADVDLMCKAVARFHRLVRAINGNVELNRRARWQAIISEITKQMARYLEPRLRDVSIDMSQSLRRPREGQDRVDSDRLLAALNGVYLLATVREARESLALNTLFETLWAETGRNLETLIERNMVIFKQDPGDRNTATRLDMAIKMAEVRFNPEYADILRRARDSAGKRVDTGMPSTD